ncbi:MAG TPA: MASE1 domain-containing protein, partial [Candidatus Paceibacterota bacterium]
MKFLRKNHFYYLLKIGGLSILYYFAAKFGLGFDPVSGFATLIWPPTGIALAAVFLLGYKMWPGIFLGAALINFHTGAPLLVALGIGLGNTLEALAGTYLLKKFKFNKEFEKLNDVWEIIFLAAGASTIISATIGVLSLYLGGVVASSSAPTTWLAWWFGDALGTLIIAPLIFVWSSNFKTRKTRLYETLAFVSFFLIVNFLVFSETIQINPPFIVSLSALLLIPLIWAGVRFGNRVAITLIFISSTLAILNTANGYGPFVVSTLTNNLAALQTYIGIVTITILILSTVIKETELNQQLFRNLIEHSYDGILMINVQGKIIYKSSSSSRISGYGQEELINQDLFTLIHPDDIPKTQEEFKNLLNHPGETAEIEVRIKRKNNKYIWIHATATNLLQEPTVKAIVVNYRDIDEHRRIDKLMGEERVKDEAILKNIGDAMITTDENMKIIMINNEAENLLGWKLEETIGKPIHKIATAYDEKGKELNYEKQPVAISMKTGKRFEATIPTHQYYCAKINGEKFPADFIATPISLKNQIIGMILLIRDASREQKIDLAKTEFVSLASHQLRTPLAIIRWYSEMLSGKNLPKAKEGKYLNEIQAANKRMIELVNAL